MARVAVASLRVTNPSYHVAIIADQQSERAMRAAGDPLLAEVDECIAVDMAAGSASFRSRFVKTNVRQVVDGPFLFLDTDVVVRGGLDEIFALDTDFAGARNHSRPTLEEQIWEGDMAALATMGWTTREDAYINGGVLFFADTEGARSLGREWHRRWQEGYARHGNHRDQPSMNSAIHDLDVRVHLLPDIYNAQFRMNAGVAWQPAIWHYYAVSGNSPETAYGQMVAELLAGGELDMGRVAEMVRNPHPWHRRGPLGELGIRLLLRYCRSSGWHAQEVRLRRMKRVCRRVRYAAGRLWNAVTGTGGGKPN